MSLSWPLFLPDQIEKSNAMEVTETKAFKQFDIVTDYSDNYYNTSETSFDGSNEETKKKIFQEWDLLQKNLPDSIFVRAYETRLDLLRAMIIGSNGTPYHDGLFFFDISIPSNYPNSPPKLHFHSHRFRLNPNLYPCGYVSLSLLNTIKDEYQWNPSESTILQVLVSLQTLVLNSRPYFNEPDNGSFAESKPSGKWQNYNRDVFNLSCKIILYQLKTPPKNFEDFVGSHFRNRGDSILKACKDYIEGQANVGYITDEKSRIRVPESFKTGLTKIYKRLVVAFGNNSEMANEDGENVKGKSKRKKKDDDVVEIKLNATKPSKRPRIDSRSTAIKEYKFI